MQCDFFTEENGLKRDAVIVSTHHLSCCILSSSSRLRLAAAPAACFSLLSMIFSVTKSRPADVEGLQEHHRKVFLKTSQWQMLKSCTNNT